MAKLLKGAPVAEAISQSLGRQVEALAGRGILPTLAIVRVGARPDDVAYQNSALKRCEKVGVAARVTALAETATQEELLAALDGLNRDAGVHGILLLRPLPEGFSDETVRAALAPEKDVDGITDASLAGVFAGTGAGYPPCTARACIEILNHYGIDPAGQTAVVVGRSLVVGKPLAMMLLGANATVTVCHTKTRDLAAVCRGAGLLFVSAGRAGVIGEEHLAEGQVVVDVGINLDEAGRLCGDVNAEAAEKLAAAYTPVPGGVGAVTSSVLAKHVVRAACRQNGLAPAIEG